MSHRHARPMTVALLLLATVGCQTARGARDTDLSAAAAAREAIANERLLDVSALPAHSIGVAPLAHAGGDTVLASLAYGLADLLMTDLAQSAQVQVVERTRLHALLRELHIAESGRVDTATAPRVGKLVGARRLVLGSLVRHTSGELRIDTRIADVSTTEIRPALAANAPLDDILVAEKELAFRLLDALGVTLSPAERAAIEQRPTRNLSALLAYSRAVRDEVHGNYAGAADNYRAATQFDPGFAVARTRLLEVDTRASGADAGAAPDRQQRRRDAVNRAASAAAEGVNRTFTLGIGGAGDPAFDAAQTMTIIITITTVP